MGPHMVFRRKFEMAAHLAVFERAQVILPVGELIVEPAHGEGLPGVGIGHGFRVEPCLAQNTLRFPRCHVGSEMPDEVRLAAVGAFDGLRFLEKPACAAEPLKRREDGAYEQEEGELAERLDITHAPLIVYCPRMPPGRLHPISAAIREIADIFGAMGFSIASGPELEDDWHNFTALNVPEDHPARDMQDTFWTKEKEPRVPRTHTTSVSIRCLEEMARTGKTSMRAIAPAKVFRNEATDMTHEAQFYQLDGFAVGPKGEVTLAHLKGTFEKFYKEYFGPEAKVRFRPSFFPFTEPSVEVDAWFQPEGKEGRWLEMAGAGMLHPTVIRNAGLDPETVAGFAFGGGIERLLMVKYGIPDVRLFHSGDIRFVHGFVESV